jgi:hypothetical protein
MSEKLSGDAELKMDWTKPPTALNAMGFYSFVPVPENVIRQTDSVRGAYDVLDRRVHEPLSRGDQHREEARSHSHGRSRAGRPIRSSRSEVVGGQRSKVRVGHEVFGTSGGEAVRPNCSIVTI